MGINEMMDDIFCLDGERGSHELPEPTRFIGVELEQFAGGNWVAIDIFCSEDQAWRSVLGDDQNYRTRCLETGAILTDRSQIRA